MKKALLILTLLTALLFTSCNSEISQTTLPGNSSFEVHYIDVGQGDSQLIICEGKSMLIDGGNVEDSSLLVSYLEELSIDHLDYIVCSHPHEDHVGGLSGPLNVLTVGKVYAPVTTADSDAYNNFLTAVSNQGLSITHPTLGETINLGSSTIQFLGPVTEDTSDINNTSIVLRIVYGDTSFLFTGDAEKESEAWILDQGFTLASTVLKVGHHGSDYSTSYTFLREVMPEYSIISVGKDNIYGHPYENLLSRLNDANSSIIRTDLQGDITIKSDGQNVTITTQKNSQTLAIPTTSNKTQVSYIGNTKSKTFHLSTCYNLPYEENRVYFDSRDDFIDKGYTPCGNCNP